MAMDETQADTSTLLLVSEKICFHIFFEYIYLKTFVSVFFPLIR